MSLRIGVLGAGKIGQLRARAIRETPGAELVAVMDVAAAAAARAVAGSRARPYTELAPFLDHAMDAVVVASPSHLHEAPCLESLQRGRHVLCEKPLSNSVASCQRIVDAAIATQRALAVGFNLRYYPAIGFVKDALDRRLIGALDHLRVFGGHEGLPKFAKEWEYKLPASGGGAMMDIGIHLTDLARFLLGEITEVYGVMSEGIWKVPGSEDNALAVFRSPDGIPASYHATWTEWKGYTLYVEAYGDRGMVRGAYGPMQHLLITQDRPGARTRTQRRHYPWIRLRERLGSWQRTALLSFKAELHDFIAMTEGQTRLRLADGYAGLRAVEVAAAVRQSTVSRQAVLLPALGRMAR